MLTYLQNAGPVRSDVDRRSGPLKTIRPSAWRPDFARIRGRVYLAIANQIEEAIRAGIFVSGDRIPPQRAIADDLGFHRNTVNAAFREAARRGLVRGCGGRGTIVL
jgi:DNA-binding GntR family transcriptional regulator